MMLLYALMFLRKLCSCCSMLLYYLILSGGGGGGIWSKNTFPLHSMYFLSGMTIVGIAMLAGLVSERTCIMSAQHCQDLSF